MPRTRTAETVQRPGPRSLRTSSTSDSNLSSHQRSRFPDNRSPRLSQPEPAKKRLGTRIANLESQLGQAQDELKCLKDKLATAEPAKKKAQPHQTEDESKTFPETDVFEVIPVSLGSKETAKREDSKKEYAFHEDVDDIRILGTEIEEKDTELELLRRENENLRMKVNEESEKISSVRSQIEELTSKFRQAQQDLEASRRTADEKIKKLEASERAKRELENEMKTLRVQTEQWRKAADAAAYFLSGGSPFESFVGPYGYRGGSMGSPGSVDGDEPGDVFGGGKKKSPSSGIRMFGDLWKKKGRK